MLEFMKETDKELYDIIKDEDCIWCNEKFGKEMSDFELKNYPIVFGVTSTIDYVEVLSIIDTLGCTKQEGAEMLKATFPDDCIYDYDSRRSTPIKLAIKFNKKLIKI